MKTRLLRNSKLAGGFGLLLALVLTVSLALPIMAVEPIPGFIVFKGNVLVCGNPMPEGTVVEAKVNGISTANTTVDGSGQYGYDAPYKVEGFVDDAIQLVVEGQVLHEQALVHLDVVEVDLLVRPTLTTSSDANGSVTTPGEGEYGPYDCAEDVPLFADPDEDYVFVNWTGDVGTVDNVTAADTFITMNGIYAIMANFELEIPGEECELTFDVTGTGSVTEPASSPESVLCGETIDLLAVETDDCWEFDGWTAETTEGLDAINAPGDPDTFITMDDNYSIHANFVQKTVTLNVDVIGTGSVTEPASSPVTDIPCGDTVALLAVETDDCWEFDGWTADTSEGLAAIDNASAADTFITMDDDYSIHANFVEKTFTLNVDSTAGGTVTEPASSPVTDIPCGDTVNLFADPDTDYVFNGWSADTTEGLAAINAAGDPDTFITMNGDYSIHANFIPEDVEYCGLTFDVIGTGSVTEPASSPESVPCGNTIDLLAVETDDCWEFDGWTADTTPGFNAIDNPALADTFITMDDDYSIHANFVLKQVYLTTDSSEGGSVTTPGEGVYGPYDCGEVVPIVATATGCYNFVEWTADSPEALAAINAAGDPDTFITMNGDYSITANFATALEEIEIPFIEGWNTFSTPISLHDCIDTWDEFIAANDLDIIMIYGYDAATEAWVPVYGDEEIKPLYGFYVKTSEAGVAHIIPNANPTGLPSRELSRGVHLIGPAPASLGDIDVVSALVTIYYAEAIGGEPPLQPWGYTLVVSPYINSPNDWEYARDGGDPPLMNSGRAYWVVMENADDYVGSTSTPLAP